MVKPIKFRIRGDRAEGHPTVDDFLDQLRDLIGIIEAIEKAMPEGESVIEWRVTQATTNSPVAIEATPFPKHLGVNIDDRVLALKSAMAGGLVSLIHEADRPPYFNQGIVNRAKKIADRVTNGLAETVIDWGGVADDLVLTPRVAAIMSANAGVILKPKIRPYTERGTLEGFHDGLSPGTGGKHELFVKSRRTGERVKCILTREAFEDIRHREIEEVLEGRRLQVRGTIHYKGPHQLDRVTAEHVRVMPRREELPSLEEIVDPDFTDGLSTEDYLDWVRGGRRLD